VRGVAVATLEVPSATMGRDDRLTTLSELLLLLIEARLHFSHGRGGERDRRWRRSNVDHLEHSRPTVEEA
jgi:hypothetical protein